MTLLHALALFAAAFAAGAVNSIAGGGTLLTFPVLLWFGLDEKIANATSTFALFPGLIGSLWGYRKEVRESRPLLWRFGVISFVGGTIGTLLLILTPNATFARLVPFLILFATVLFMLQEPLARRLRSSDERLSVGDGDKNSNDAALVAKRDEQVVKSSASAQKLGGRWWSIGSLLQLVAGVYGAYFGAGNGILILAVLGLSGVADIHRANGVKVFLAIVLNSIAIVGFALSGLIVWTDALLMAVAALAGGYYGANLARRLGQKTIRRVVIAIGLTIFALMLWRIVR